MTKKRYGLDIGTYSIKLFDQKSAKVWTTKNVIAIKDKTEVVAVGDKAYEMYEKTSSDVRFIFPMKSGIITHFKTMQYLLNQLVWEKAPFTKGAEYLLAVPTDVTEVEKRAFCDLVSLSAAKARSIRIADRSIADAIGCDIDIWRTDGVVIANFGGGTTELTLLSKGGIVLNRLMQTGGDYFDLALISFVRRHYDLLIGRHSAERLRREISLSDTEDEKGGIYASGRDIALGIPMKRAIPMALLRDFMKELLEDAVQGIVNIISRTSADIRQGILKNGIYLTGGLAKTIGLSAYIEERTGIPVKISEYPQHTVAIGLQAMMLEKEYKDLTYAMLNEDYRWLQ